MTRLSFGDTTLDITSDGKIYEISSGGQAHRVELLDTQAGRLELLVDGRRVLAYVSSDGPDRWVTVNGRTARLTRASTARRSAGVHDSSSELTAPMPGQVRAVHIAPGDGVTKGQVLVVLEAMKMEIRIQAPFDGTVATVNVKTGQTVEREQVLVALQRIPS